MTLITPVTLKDEFKVCPACGYQDGFHTMLKKENRAVRLLLICPSCHAIFDPALTLEQPSRQ